MSHGQESSKPSSFGCLKLTAVRNKQTPIIRSAFVYEVPDGFTLGCFGILPV